MSKKCGECRWFKWTSPFEAKCEAQSLSCLFVIEYEDEACRDFEPKAKVEG